MEIGARIKELRLKKGISQAKLARAVGVTPAAVGNYEQGISVPKQSVLRKLFVVLDCTPNELLSDDDYLPEEYEHLKRYSMLSEEGKRVVDECTERELSKVESVRIAARQGETEIALKKRTDKSIFNAEDYKR